MKPENLGFEQNAKLGLGRGPQSFKECSCGCRMYDGRHFEEKWYNMDNLASCPTMQVQCALKVV